MAKDTIHCAWDARVLKGYDKAEYVERESIYFKGIMVRFQKDTTGVMDMMYITPSANAELSFCSIDCLTNYIERRTEEYKRMGINRKMEQARSEHMDRLANDTYTGKRGGWL